MAKKNIRLGNYEPDITVTIGDHDYTLKAFTLDVETGLNHIQGRIDEINTRQELAAVGEGTRPAPLEIVETMAEQLDVMLVTPSGAPDPSEVVIEAYKAGKTTRPDIDALCEELAQAISTPPT